MTDMEHAHGRSANGNFIVCADLNCPDLRAAEAAARTRFSRRPATPEDAARAHLLGQGMRPDLIDWTMAQPEARKSFGLDIGGFGHSFSQKRVAS